VEEQVAGVRRVYVAEDPALRELSSLLETTFADPDTVLELDRIQAFLGEQSASLDRQFCVVVAEAGGRLLGGTIFSYVPPTNCGFSEYLVVRKDRHGHGIGRRLFDARRAVLDELAQESQQKSCSGLFIEADNPDRTPLDLQARGRETAMDTLVRLQVFAHLGFLRVDLDYVQPALGPGKQPVHYLDLLFAPWAERVRSEDRVPAGWVTQTLCAIWASWASSIGQTACAALRQRLGETPVAILPLSPPEQQY
jgi:GNAT superfamily N-acetyltransferase